MERDETHPVLWGGLAIKNYAESLTGETIPKGTFYSRLAAGKYGPVRRVGTTLVSTVTKVRLAITGES
jgi:hypothetical protein